MTAKKRFTFVCRVWAVHALVPRYPGWNRVDMALYQRAYAAYAQSQAEARG